jgi:hypothetical protein
LKYDRSKTQLMRERAKSLTPIAYGELYWDSIKPSTP